MKSTLHRALITHHSKIRGQKERKNTKNYALLTMLHAPTGDFLKRSIIKVNNNKSRYRFKIFIILHVITINNINY